MGGILVINKEKGCTSRDVVNQVCKILHTKKIGHTGTLDPLATGTLVLCIGKSTKLVEIITGHEKEYRAEVVLGIETDTLDITGNILKEEQIHKTKEEIEKVLKSFEKTYDQVAPIYSAIKIKGKKLYEYAREGISVELPKREVTIFKIKLESVFQKEEKTHFIFSTVVSKGTYIRSLIRDIAFSLETVGVMKELCRTRQGHYKIEDSYTVEDVQSGKYTLIEMESALTSYPKIKVSKEIEDKIGNGCILKNIYNVENPLFINENGKILALYKPYKEDLLKPWKMFDF